MNEKILSTNSKIINIPRYLLAFLKFLFEGYDHLALISVLDGKNGRVEITYYPTEEKIVENLLEEILKEFH